MSKILIASIGTGAKNNDIASYRKATYTSNFSDEKITTPYVYTAVQKFYNIDETILIGTAGSDWCSLYFFVCDLHNITPDEKIAEQLLKLADGKDNHTFSLDKVYEIIKPLKEFFYDIIIIKYGLTNDELNESFAELKKIENKISDGDKIYFDITHSFRSLSMFEMIAVKYLKEVCGKKITLEAVTYGILDASKEFDGETPIINLSHLLTMMDYSKAIDEYTRFGTTYALCDVLEQNDNQLGLTKENIKALSLLNDDIMDNDFDNFKKMVGTCHKIVEKKYPSSSNADIAMLTKSIIGDIDRYFYFAINDDTMLRMKLAEWHYGKKRRSTAAVTMQEAIITFCAELCELDANNYDLRDEIKNNIKAKNTSNEICKDFCNTFNKLRQLRNRLAHPTSKNYSNDIAELKNYLSKLISMYNKHFKDKNSECCLALKDALSQK